MKKYESVIIGHITLDENIDYTGKKVYGEGGAVLYSSAAAFGTGHRVAAFTATAEKDKNRLDAFRLPKEDVFWVQKEKSTDMYNRYFTADRERRESLCTSRGTPFEKEDFRILPESEIYHLAGLLYGDYGEGTIGYLAEKGRLAVDVQGYLRRADENGKMYFSDWKEKEKLIPFITYLKTDAAEAEILTGTKDRAEAARLLCGMGAKEAGEGGVEAAFVHGVDAADAQRLVVAGSGVDLADEAVLEVADALGVTQKQLPLLRQLDAPLPPREQLAAGLVFELGDAVGDRRLRDVHALRRAGEILQF